MKMISPDCTDASARQMASDMLRRPRVQSAMAARVEGDELVGGRIERLRYLTRVMRGEETEERVVQTKEGAQVVQVRLSARDRMHACEMLAKAAGEHLPKAPGTNDGAGFAGMSVQQLFELATKGALQ
jgi:phage terminase small subunit